MRRIVLGLAALILPAQPGFAASTAINAAGTARAAAVLLHCTATSGLAVPCGTVALPVVVAPSAGALTSRTEAVAAQTSTALFPANPVRRYLAIQVPAGTGIWINVMGGPAAANGPDCINFPAGTFYETGSFVNTGGITVYSPVATTISAWEG